MDIAELKRYIHLGQYAVTVFRKPFLGNIDIIIRVPDDNRVFLDYDDEEDEEGGLRVTLTYDSFDTMIDAIEKYVGDDTKLYKIYHEPENKECNHEDWLKLRDYVYNHKIDLMDNYQTLRIGDRYWRGLYFNEISPTSSREEIEAWYSRASNYDYDDND